MRSKTLMAVAVAGTFGWASAAHAGPGHHASSMADEAYYPSTVLFDSDGMGTMDSSASAVLLDGTYSEYYLVSWTPSSASEWDNYVILEPSSSDMMVLLDDGASTVSMSEVMASNSNTIVLFDGAGYELIPASSDTIVLFDPATYELMPSSSDTLVLLDDEAYVVSTYEVIRLPSDFTQAGGS